MRQITKVLVIAGVTAAAGTQVANAADFYVSIGVPGMVFAAPGVGYAPPVYVPPPVYYPRRPAFEPAYAYAAPWGHRWHEWHEREEWREHHGRPEWREHGDWHERHDGDERGEGQHWGRR